MHIYIYIYVCIFVYMRVYMNMYVCIYCFIDTLHLHSFNGSYPAPCRKKRGAQDSKEDSPELKKVRMSSAWAL